MAKNRLYELDILRAASFLGVVAQHVLGAWANRGALVGGGEKFAISVCFELVRFAVPMFVLLCGATLFYNYDEKLRPGPYLKRRAVQILLPYLVWSLIYFARSCFYGGGLPSGWAAQLVKNLLTGGAAYHLWYPVMIFQFFILAPLLLRLGAWIRRVADSPAKRLLCALVIVAAGLAYTGISPRLDWPPPLSSFFGRYRSLSFASWIIFFAVGAALGSNPGLRFPKPAAAGAAAASLAAFAYAVTLDFQYIKATGSVNFSTVSFLNPGFSLLMAAVLTTMFICARRLVRFPRLCRVCGTVGRLSFDAYLVHVLILSDLSILLAGRLSALPLPIFYTLLFILTAGGSLFFAWILEVLKKKLKKIT